MAAERDGIDGRWQIERNSVSIHQFAKCKNNFSLNFIQ